MKCEKCNCNEATIHIQEIRDGKQRAWNLCLSCATELNLPTPDGSEIQLSDIVGKLAGQAGPETQQANPQEEDNVPDIACPFCGLTAAEMRRNGRLGCPECYNAFSDLLSETLEELHAGTCHCGKTPHATHVDAVTMVRVQAALLEEQLAEAVAIEDYERAGEVRDALQEVRAQLHLEASG